MVTPRPPNLPPVSGDSITPRAAHARRGLIIGMSVHYSDQAITVFSLKGKIYCLLWVTGGGGGGGVVNTELS